MGSDDFSRALDRQAKANDAMYSGDPELYIAMWSQADDANLFGSR